MERGVRARLTAKEGRHFGLTVGLAFVALAGLLAWRGHVTGATVAAAVGALLVVAGVVVPGRLDPVHRAWMGLATAISKVTTPIIMSVVYFVVITPFGLVRRAMGGSPVVHRSAEGTYWKRRAAGRGRGDLTRQF